MDKEPGSASFPNSERYTSPRAGANAAVQVVVEGQVCAATVLGRNGPRIQLRFELNGGSYVRWFDSAEILAG